MGPDSALIQMLSISNPIGELIGRQPGLIAFCRIFTYCLA